MAPLVPPQNRAAFEAQWNVTIQTMSNSSATCAPELFGGNNASPDVAPDLFNDGTASSVARTIAIENAIASCGPDVAFTQWVTTGLTAEVFAPIYGGAMRSIGTSGVLSEDSPDCRLSCSSTLSPSAFYPFPRSTRA